MTNRLVAAAVRGTSAVVRLGLEVTYRRGQGLELDPDGKAALELRHQVAGLGGVEGAEVIMWLVMRRHAANQREYDSMHLIGEQKHFGT